MALGDLKNKNNGHTYKHNSGAWRQEIASRINDYISAGVQEVFYEDSKMQFDLTTRDIALLSNEVKKLKRKLMDMPQPKSVVKPNLSYLGIDE